MTEPTHLRVLQQGGLYRAGPSDIAYRSKQEFAYCKWCRHYTQESEMKYHRRAGTSGWYTTTRYDACKIQWVPDPRKPNLKFRGEKYNPEGTCILYKPSRWTRFIRLFGLRKAVYRARPSV